MKAAVQLLAVFAILGIGTKVYGLKCWSCSKVTTNEECNALGSLKTCRANQACINRVVRDVDGSYAIDKGCRGRNAKICKADPQNTGMYSTKCTNEDNKSICSCCCSTDSCNAPQMECKDVVHCRKPGNPGNGKIRCPRSISYGSKCTITCNRGFTRSGSRSLTCTNGTNEGYWMPRTTAACLAIQKKMRPKKEAFCKVQKAPQHGSMVCENKGENKNKRPYNYIGTVCAFKCNNGYFLTGQESTECLPGGHWSTQLPKCKKGKCQKPLQDKNRIDQCSDDYYFDSVCSISCKLGYLLVGSSESTCETVNGNIRQGMWTNTFAQCVKAVCRPQLTKPPNGKLECSKENSLGSICTFTCNNGYDRVDDNILGNGQLECEEIEEKVDWNGTPPTCKKITCPQLESPGNGYVVCSGEKSLGTKCTFSCKFGYDIIGTSEISVDTVCQDAGTRDGIGAWSVESISCAPIRCEPPREAPLNGKVSCSDGNHMGSICTYSCDLEYDLDDTTEKVLMNTCNGDVAGDGLGQWSANQGTCSTKFTCTEVMTDPQNGKVSCDNEAFMGSVCQFTCNKGYEMSGINRIACLDIENDGDSTVEWSGPAPVCVASVCPVLWHDSKNVQATCPGKVGDGYAVGSKCTYECVNPGFYLETDDSKNDNGVITCIAKNTWSKNSAPRCFPKTCPPLDKIDNGNQAECSNGNQFGSECRYKCNQKYKPSHNDALKCDVRDSSSKVGFWDKDPPKCILNECVATPGNPSKGTVTCSSGAKIGSFCTLECSRGYAPKVQRIDCQLADQEINGELVEVPQFLLLKEFCCAQCRSDFNIVHMIEGSTTQKVQNVVEFVKMFLAQLTGQENQVVYSAFAFNNEVQEASAVKGVEISDTETVAEIVEQMEKWTVNKPGKGSQVKAAIDFAESLFTSGDGANFLIVSAEDEPKNINKATIAGLSAQGIQVIVAARNNFAKITWEKLFNDGDNVVNQDSNEIMKRIYDQAFKNGCSNLAPNCV